MTKERTMRISRKYPTKREVFPTFREWHDLGFDPQLIKPKNVHQQWTVTGMATPSIFVKWCSIEAKREQSK